MSEEFVLQKAVREAAPMLIALSGTSGSGKTLSGLLLAAGLAGPKGVVGMIDAENKRGSLYADDPLVMSALPDGYGRMEISNPYSPARYIEAVTACEKAGVTVCLIDSTSHEWEGEGGACEIAERFGTEKGPNWQKAKREHKKFLAHCMSSQMHIVFCLRAREKVMMLKRGDSIPGTNDRAEKGMVIPLGVQPIAEKNFVFEMLLSLRFDETTHYAYPIKVPKMLASYFPGGRLITKADGDAIREWNESGGAGDPYGQLRKRARAAAEDGMASYEEFFRGITPVQRKALASGHEEYKRVANQADADFKAAEAANANTATEQNF